MNKFMELVEKNNKAFSKANKARKRVMIARDVIMGIKMQFLQEYGGYLSRGDEYWKAEDNASFREVLKTPEYSCGVCAKGAIFVCTVANRNKVTNEEVSSIAWKGEYLTNMLGNIFEARQLDLIESYFECNRWVDGFSEKDRMERMTLIMENIIANKGTFVPEKLS